MFNKLYGKMIEEQVLNHVDYFEYPLWDKYYGFKNKGYMSDILLYLFPEEKKETVREIEQMIKEEEE